VRWQDPVTYICSRLQGFQIGGLLRWFESNTYYRQPVAVESVRWTAPILVPDYRFARANAGKPVKPVITGPYTLATLSITRAHPSHRDFVLELARELNKELRSLADEGPEWIQIDEPAIAKNPSTEYPRDFEVFAEAMHVLSEGVPGKLSLYVYHGSAADIPGLLSLPFSLFGFDLVQGAESWNVLRTWRPEKAVGLGIVDARNVKLEDENGLITIATTTARNTGAADVHISPSCGLEFLPRDIARRKLELVARAAHGAEVSV
jgi:5-methyltetrahydropteroyltriglutamate--homocysteine methyltransferase